MTDIEVKIQRFITYAVALAVIVLFVGFFAQVWIADTKMLKAQAEGPYRKEKPGVCVCR